MTDKEMRRLNRRELLEMMLALSRENDDLRCQLDQMKQQLSERQLMIERAGSIAEASIQISHVFEAAQEAAEQYLDNIRSLSGRQEQICLQREEESQRKARILLEETERHCRAMEKDTEEKCAVMEKEAEERASQLWEEAHMKIQDFVDQQGELREMLSVMIEGAGHP